MGVRVQCCYDIDLPSAAIKLLEQSIVKAQDGTYILHTSPRAFIKEFPMLAPHLAKDGWLTSGCDLCLIVSKEDDTQVDEPVAQPASV